MPVFDLTDDEAQVLIRLVRRAIDDDCSPMAPRLDPMKALLAKLDPPKPAAPRPSAMIFGTGHQAFLALIAIIVLLTIIFLITRGRKKKSDERLSRAADDPQQRRRPGARQIAALTGNAGSDDLRGSLNAGPVDLAIDGGSSELELFCSGG